MDLEPVVYQRHLGWLYGNTIAMLASAFWACAEYYLSATCLLFFGAIGAMIVLMWRTAEPITLTADKLLSKRLRRVFGIESIPLAEIEEATVQRWPFGVSKLVLKLREGNFSKSLRGHGVHRSSGQLQLIALNATYLKADAQQIAEHLNLLLANDKA